MSTDSGKSFIPDPTQGDYWGGYMMDSWLYKLLAVFPITGFLGMDHLALRSPFTAVLKFLVNVFFWGAWYFYDIIQMMTDNTFVAKYGMSTPWAPRGHGYKFFKDLTETNIDEFQKSSTYNGGAGGTVLFVTYAILTLTIGFSGIPNMIVGDFYGGLIKLFSNFLIIPFIAYVIAQVGEFFSSGSVQKEGISHPWPMYPLLTIFEKYPATSLNGVTQANDDLKTHTTKYEPLLKAGKLPVIPEVILGLFGKLYEALNNIPAIAAFNTVTAAKGAALATSEMAQSAAKVGQTLASAVERKIVKDPDAIVDKVLGVTGDIIQKGGAQSPIGIDTLVMGGIVTLVVGGFATAIFRKITTKKRTDDEYPRNSYERDDAPPIPGRT
jgi:hypothetical protein